MAVRGDTCAPRLQQDKRFCNFVVGAEALHAGTALKETLNRQHTNGRAGMTASH